MSTKKSFISEVTAATVIGSCVLMGKAWMAAGSFSAIPDSYVTACVVALVPFVLRQIQKRKEK